jgi:hypothetical protein
LTIHNGKTRDNVHCDLMTTILLPTIGDTMTCQPLPDDQAPQRDEFAEDDAGLVPPVFGGISDFEDFDDDDFEDFDDEFDDDFEEELEDEYTLDDDEFGEEFDDGAEDSDLKPDLKELAEEPDVDTPGKDEEDGDVAEDDFDEDFGGET